MGGGGAVEGERSPTPAPLTWTPSRRATGPWSPVPPQCTGDIFPTQFDFFNNTLALRAKYDIVEALAAAKITPSNTRGFTLKDFNSALVSAYGYSALLTCDKQGRVETAVQCISKDLQLMDCPSNIPRACSYSTVYLPASM